jgi:hypothetical protein
MRLYHVGLVGLLPLVLIRFYALLGLPDHDPQRLIYARTTLLIAAGFALNSAMFFASEDRRSSPLIRDQARRVPALLRPLLFPGGLGGPLFSALIAVALPGVVFLFHLLRDDLWAIAVPSDWADPEGAWRRGTMTLISYLLCLSALGLLLARLIADRAIRIVVMALFIVVTVGAPPLLHRLLAAHPLATLLDPLSPFLTFGADWSAAPSNDAPWGRLGLGNVGRGLYLGATASLCALGLLLGRRRDEPPDAERTA